MEEEEAKEENNEDPTAEPSKEEAKASTNEPSDSSVKPELSSEKQEMNEPSSDNTKLIESSDPKPESEDRTNPATESSEESRDVNKQFFSLSLTENKPEFDPQETIIINHIIT